MAVDTTLYNLTYSVIGAPVGTIPAQVKYPVTLTTAPFVKVGSDLGVQAVPDMLPLYETLIAMSQLQYRI